MIADNNKQDKIQYEDLEKAVKDARQKKDLNDFSFLMGKDEIELKYMQKFAEVEISKKDTYISIPSILVGFSGIVLSLISIGLAFVLVGNSINSIPKIIFTVAGTIIIFYGGWIFRMIYKSYKKFEDAGAEIEYMHELLLEIERKLFLMR